MLLPATFVMQTLAGELAVEWAVAPERQGVEAKTLHLVKTAACGAAAARESSTGGWPAPRSDLGTSRLRRRARSVELNTF
jgi:hypothetical protein